MKLILFFTASLITQFIFAQHQAPFLEYTKKAYELYDSKDYLASARKFEESLNYMDDEMEYAFAYNIACAYAMAEMQDSAFYHLKRSVKKGNFSNLDQIKADTVLAILHNHKRWGKLVSRVEKNATKAEAKLDRPLMRILDSIEIEDQRYLWGIDSVISNYGKDSKEMDNLNHLIETTISSNLTVVKEILDKRGWIGEDVIGFEGCGTLFLVIQHADLETQQKYLPSMRKAMKKGNVHPSNLAFLEDRVAMGKGEKQIYGSQLTNDDYTVEYYVYPLIDPDNVNIRRAEVGLGPIEDYIEYWDLKWDVEAHKKMVLQWEKNNLERLDFRRSRY